jgi:hypothetical protein
MSWNARQFLFYTILQGGPRNCYSKCFLLQDGGLYQHSFKDAIRPADNVNPQSISFNCKGDILFACKANPSVVKQGKGSVK